MSDSIYSDYDLSVLLIPAACNPGCLSRQNALAFGDGPPTPPVYAVPGTAQHPARVESPFEETTTEKIKKFIPGEMAGGG